MMMTASQRTDSILSLQESIASDPLVIACVGDYDQDDYAARLNYNRREMAPSLVAFRSARATTAQLFEFMSDDDWRREGTHSESGSYTAEDWLKIYAAHAHNHAAQIQRLKEALSESAAATA